MTYMPQIKYMFASMITEPNAKRQRVNQQWDTAPGSGLLGQETTGLLGHLPSSVGQQNPFMQNQWDSDFKFFSETLSQLAANSRDNVSQLSVVSPFSGFSATPSPSLGPTPSPSCPGSSPGLDLDPYQYWSFMGLDSTKS